MEKIFIDTNVIIDLLRGKEKTVSFFKQVESGEIDGFTNRIVFLETIHVYLILKTGKGPLNLRKKPEIVKSADISPILEVFEILHIYCLSTKLRKKISLRSSLNTDFCPTMP